MTPKEFQKQFKRLLMTRVDGMDWDDKLAKVRQYLRQLEARQRPEDESAELSPSIEIIPFEPGRRPVDEALYPGHGCSERVGFLSSKGTPADFSDEIWVLYRLHDIYSFLAPFDRPFDVTLSAWFLPPTQGSGEPCPVPGLTNVALKPKVASSTAYPIPELEDASWQTFHQTCYVTTIDPTRQLLPRAASGTGYLWSDVAESLRKRTPDGHDPFTFAHTFRQSLRLEVALTTEGHKLSSDAIDVEVYDTSRFGSLYTRLQDLIVADTETQRAESGQEDLHVGYHPWFPVLTIGMDKAMLYLKAIHEDLDEHRRNLPDPQWLLRVGLYLELLTCLGIFEAVKEDYPDLLSKAERKAFETSDTFAPIRERLDVRAWKRVWDLREILPRSAFFLTAGPVSLRNLMQKQNATLAFLHTHHEDLKNAIELSGRNLCNAQETWHRVFRDAERAVLRNSVQAFPELTHLDPHWREMALWHQAGSFKWFGFPEVLTSLFGDQDGIYPSACRQYRKSMNDVAKWAAERNLMDYTGDECIPKNASLLEAQMEQNAALFTVLQRRDGHSTLDVEEPQIGARPNTVDDIAALLRKIPVFKPLMDRELKKLASKARSAMFGPLDRIVLQGQKDSAMFVVASGSVEVLVRQQDGRDLSVATLEHGAVFGEFALLTGEERTATVRAVGEVVLYEITKEAIQPIIEARPQLVVELSMLMAARQLDLRDAAERHNEEKVNSLASRIRRFVLG